MAIISTESLIQTIRARVQAEAPDMLPLFESYANEAGFARQLLDKNLQRLRPGDEIVEIGAGIFLLSCQLKSEGFSITALEPAEKGFSHLHKLQQLVLGYASEAGISPIILPIPAEQLTLSRQFTFAYSINVMEHVQNVGTVLERVYEALKPGGIYRFICPNYSFPYEAHFNIPTFGSKKMTHKLMKQHIAKREAALGASGLWDSLNWITVGRVSRYCLSILGTAPTFDRNIIHTYIVRALEDKGFRARHSPFIHTIVSGAHKLGLTGFARYIPSRCLPVMDCTLIRS